MINTIALATLLAITPSAASHEVMEAMLSAWIQSSKETLKGKESKNKLKTIPKTKKLRVTTSQNQQDYREYYEYVRVINARMLRVQLPIDALLAAGRLEEVWAAAERAKVEVPEFIGHWDLYQTDVRLRQGKFQEAFDRLSLIENRGFDVLYRYYVAAARIGRPWLVDFDECHRTIVRLYDPSYMIEPCLPRSRDAESIVFMAGLAGGSGLGTYGRMGGWFLRQAESIYPANPVLCDQMIQYLGESVGLQTIRDYADRGARGALGRLAETMEGQRKWCEFEIERRRRR